MPITSRVVYLKLKLETVSRMNKSELNDQCHYFIHKYLQQLVVNCAQNLRMNFI